MIVNKYNTGGGSGQRGPQGYQGPEGPQGAQGPAGSGSTGDSHILLASSGAPAGLAEGDVWAQFIPAEGPVYGDFDNTHETTIQYSRSGDDNPQAIRFSLSNLEGGILNIRYAIEEWDSMVGLSFTNGEIYCDAWGWQQIDQYHVVFDDSEWMERTGGKTVRAEIDGEFFYFYSEDPSIIWIYGVADNTNNVSIWEGTVTPSHDDIATAYQVLGGTSRALAKTEDIPSDDRLLPSNADDTAMLIFNTTPNKWLLTNRNSVVNDGLASIGEYDETKGSNQTLVRSSYWDIKWKPVDNSVVEAVSALPITSKDGSVYAYANASGYGIAQAQSAVSQMTWMNYPDTTEVSAGFTQIRVPYTAYSFIVEFVTNNGSEACNLWWHGEDSPNHWDASNLDVSGQVDGEFSVTDPNGTLITSVRSGDYLVVTFANTVTQVNAVSNLDIYQSVDAAIYTNAVMSDAVTKIWKGTAAEYADLQSYDNNTFYIIL